MLSSPSSEFAKKPRCYESWWHQNASLALPSPRVDPHLCTLPMDQDSHFSSAQGHQSLPEWCSSASSQPCLWMSLGYSLPYSSVCALIPSSLLHSLGRSWTWLTTLTGLGLLRSLLPAPSSAHSAQVLEDIALSIKSLSGQGSLTALLDWPSGWSVTHSESWSCLSSVFSSTLNFVFKISIYKVLLLMKITQCLSIGC